MDEQQLLDQISIRGLKDSGTPLREFKGKLESYSVDPPDTRYLKEGEQGKNRVTLNFSEIKVIKSTEPYLFPVAQIGITYSDKSNSMWGIFSKSLGKCVPESEDLKHQVGRTFHMLMTPNHKFGRDRVSGADIIRDAWEVQGVEGAATAQVNPLKKALDLLDGKTEPDFHQAVFQDGDVKKDTSLFSSILNKQFIPSMIDAGQVTKDADGIYHVVRKEG